MERGLVEPIKTGYDEQVSLFFKVFLFIFLCTWWSHAERTRRCPSHHRYIQASGTRANYKGTHAFTANLVVSRTAGPYRGRTPHP